ncbi:MAG: alkaline phosphatase family protein [Candidatus Aminicenantes bacterium]|nr:alkaline phosphatase family protein [Candidatus Aminicenantes bacterium]
MRFFKKNKKKLLIIGLDGVPYEMIKGFAGNAMMPNLKKLFASGRLVKMAASIPEISAVSWSGFMTGTDSGNHGIFGFVDLAPAGYDYRFPNFYDLRVPPFFEWAASTPYEGPGKGAATPTAKGPGNQVSDRGDRKAYFFSKFLRGSSEKRSVIINLPATYPARKIPGVLVSGFVAIDLKKAVYPAKYFPVLEELGYEIDIGLHKGKEDKSRLISDLHRVLAARKKAADFFWKEEKWDLFMFTITGTDRLHHFLFDAYADKAHPFHEEFCKYYREVDRIIGDFLDKIAGKQEFQVIVLSDHGFGLIEQEVYLTPILRNRGFFETGAGKVKSLEDITGGAKAFALDPSRIFIHTNGRFPRGRVSKGDYEKIRSEIKQLFEDYEINGKKVIKKVYFKEEIYSPRFLDRAADIILLANHGFDLKSGLKKEQEYGRSFFTGMHLQDNAFFFTDRPELLPEKMTIFDVKNIITEILA